MTDAAMPDSNGAHAGFALLAAMFADESLLPGPPGALTALDQAEDILVAAQSVHRRFSQVAGEPGMPHLADAALQALAGRSTELRQRALALRAGVSKVLADPQQLPPAPLVYQTLSRLVDDPKSSPNQVSDVVATDPASTSRLLQVVNSPFFGLRTRVDTVSKAVRMLGFEPVRNLVLAITAGNMFTAPRGVSATAVEDLWRHSIGVGVAAKVIGRRMGAPDVEQCFIAGLLHDIGKIVLLRSAPVAFQATLELAAEENAFFMEAESWVCGTDHAAIGVMLAEKWAFPQTLTEAVSLHHQPEAARAHPELVASVHVADIVCRALAIGSGGDLLVPALHRSALDTLGLDVSNLKAIVDAVELEYPEVEANLMPKARSSAA